MALRLAVRGAFGSHNLDELCGMLDPVLALDGPADVLVDLSGLDQASPAALALLVAYLRDAQRDPGCDPTWHYVPPRSPVLSRTMTPARFRHLVLTRARDAEDGPSDPVLSCEPFSTRETIDRVTAHFEAFLAERSGAGRDDFGAVTWMLGDVADNVLQHAGTHSGVAAARIYPRTHEIELAVADRGIGIRASLTKNPDYLDVTDDRSALMRAVEPATTSEPGVGGGNGLFVVSLVVKENGGALTIRSGRAALNRHGADIETTGGLPALQGTVVAIRVSTRKPLDFERVDGLLQRPAGVTAASSGLRLA
ncbi:MAG TPA: hypothetical protein VF520_12510 [Thermoleophilaceae bacterium]|jgi:ABC-type transporter Mla MlaB component/anti-sigma regulatory factor (Ser/Thr protein kinase)